MMQSRARGVGAFIVPPGWGWCLERSPSLLCPPSFVAAAAALSHGAEDVCVARAQGTGHRCMDASGGRGWVVGGLCAGV